MKKSTAFICSILSIVLGVFVFSCSKTENATGKEPMNPLKATREYDTVTSLANLKSDTVIWNLKGQYIMVTHLDATEEENEGAFKTSSCVDAFAGSARSAAKTSFVSASYGTYSSINAMRSTLQTDAYMKSLGITNSSGRVSDENHNRSITTSYLYAIARESDNDFHMIIGDANSSASNLFNCEASGNPPSSQSSYTAINSVRSYIKSYFGTDFCGQSKWLYQVYTCYQGHTIKRQSFL